MIRNIYTSEKLGHYCSTNSLLHSVGLMTKMNIVPFVLQIINEQFYNLWSSDLTSYVLDLL